LKYPKINDTAYISVNDIDFAKFTYAVLPSKDYKMKLYFKTNYFSFSKIIRNETYKYIIINKKHKSFDLKYIGDDDNTESFHKIKMKHLSWKHLMQNYMKRQNPG